MIAIDMDGTLVHPGGFVSTVNQAALRRTHDAGARIVIATGRRHSYAMKILRGIALDPADVLLSSNGTVARTISGTVLFRHTMPLETARWLCTELGEFRDSFVLTFDLLGEGGEDVPGALVLEQMDALHGSIRNWMEANAKFIHRIQPIETSLSEANRPIQAMLCGTLNRMRKAEAMLTAAHDDRLSLTRTEYPARDLCILDILPAGCSKGHGLVELLRMHVLEASDLMSIGDNWNDLPMLELARWPVLMGNAPLALQVLARERGWPIMQTHDQNAVADALDFHFGPARTGRTEHEQMVL